MAPALLIRLRPLTPFRFGPSSGARDQTDLTSTAIRSTARCPPPWGNWAALTSGWRRPRAPPSPPSASLLCSPSAAPGSTLPAAHRVAAAGCGSYAQERPLHPARRCAHAALGRISVRGPLADRPGLRLPPAIERNLPLRPVSRQPSKSRRRGPAGGRQRRVALHRLPRIRSGRGTLVRGRFAGESAASSGPIPWSRRFDCSAIRASAASAAAAGAVSKSAEEPEFLAPAGNGQPQTPGGRFRCSVPVSTTSVDWERGNYTLVSRTGRVDSTGALKRAARMVEEGRSWSPPHRPSERARRRSRG